MRWWAERVGSTFEVFLFAASKVRIPSEGVIGRSRSKGSAPTAASSKWPSSRGASAHPVPARKRRAAAKARIFLPITFRLAPGEVLLFLLRGHGWLVGSSSKLIVRVPSRSAAAAPSAPRTAAWASLGAHGLPRTHSVS